MQSAPDQVSGKQECMPVKGLEQTFLVNLNKSGVGDCNHMLNEDLGGASLDKTIFFKTEEDFSSTSRLDPSKGNKLMFVHNSNRKVTGSLLL
jgi:hypothetical protein